MKQLTIEIPDTKFRFIIELFRKYSFVKIEVATDECYKITEEQKVLVNKELQQIEANPDYALDWDLVKHQLKYD